MIQISLQKQLSGAKGPLNLDLQANFQTNKTYAIFGESGSGKTTFFKMLCGITPPDSGYISYNNQVLYDKKAKINTPVWKRNIGFVFQNCALFPHLNVYKNITFGLNKSLKSQVDSLISLLNLNQLCDKKPKHLSGGQAQKVALARSILQNPKILLLDEPFSALDQDTKTFLYQEFKNTLKHFNLTTFLISHDITEVLFLTDHVFVLEDGKFCKNGSPQEIFLEQNNHKIFGKILSIKKQGDKSVLQVLVQNMIFNFILENVDNSLKIGDMIAVDNHFSINRFQKF
ncbi:ATP-binding cassette domain-containing protein [Helicobacter sp. faydin-H20]|uniref:ATP-binding cassette domain-containing protein n=1 Tax=Helicobacter anatolicus TaxID=2905874 RepID=UPI001E617BEF|nr:ATP-binding cassette domain-containing protein [Helicobacter anatolicus]MCE3037270.1 ATP-binding cassette domain-containing protein [Helicobacter anatolicus]